MTGKCIPLEMKRVPVDQTNAWKLLHDCKGPLQGTWRQQIISIQPDHEFTIRNGKAVIKRVHRPFVRAMSDNSYTVVLGCKPFGDC